MHSENKPNKRGKYQDAKPPYFYPQTPDTGEVLGQAETKLAIIKATRGTEKLSQAEVVQWFNGEKNIPDGSLCRLVLPGEAETSKKKKSS